MTVYEKVKGVLNLDLAPDELQRRYKQERDKRVRADSENQFIATIGAHAHYLTDDPYTPDRPREPLVEDLEFLIVGGGWVGLMTAARLAESGVQDFRIVDGASDFGGTWYWNRYPGAQCDIQSYIYLPLLEETGYIPKERYSFAPEIFEHAQRIGTTFGLYDKAIFQTWVTEICWDEAAGRWIISTSRGDRIRARFVALGTGSASVPRLPGVPGIDSFKGRMFHTSRWDYGYTGADLENLADKRVAVIGTGATGIQAIPRVAARAGHLYVYQRTPSTVSPRGNRATDPAWAQSLRPGWQKELLREFDAVSRGRQPIESEALKSETILAMARAMQELRTHVDPGTLSPQELDELVELADHKTMAEIRRRVDATVTNAEHAALLKTWYRFFCKRPTFNDEYLEAFNRPNVTLIDVSAAKGIDRITERGIVANGTEVEVDCIVLASGFEITSDYRKRIGFEIIGEGGASIYDHWGEGMRTMHGLMVHGCPNLFIVGGLFAFTLGLNYSASVDDQARQVAYIVNALDARGANSAHPTIAAEDAWIDRQVSGPPSFADGFGGRPESCTPGYFNQEGRRMAERRDARRDGFPLGANAYAALLEAWRDQGDLEGLEFAGEKL